MSNISYTQADVDYLLTPVAIRERTKKVFDLAQSGGTNFKVNLDKLDETTDFVMEVIKDNYPKLDIPFHSRWGHFKVGGIDRLVDFNKQIADQDAIEQVRTKLDLVITSVLLDAGAGKEWSFNEESTGKQFNRSEGLAIASYHMFLNGDFSSTGSKQADGLGMLNFSNKKLEKGFQVSENNPLIGVDGRVSLIKKLGDAVVNNPTFFPKKRVGSIIDYLIEKHGKSFEVQDILNAVLLSLGSIWPGRIALGDNNLGDVWHYAPLGEKSINTLVPFHKLSQWLTYSMVEPMIDAGLDVTGAEKLTGLAEYRNGGLFVDCKVIELRNPELMNQKHLPSSDLIIEWRALTLTLLDLIGKKVQDKLGKTESEFPLAKVLEGGTWWAGRRIAAKLREDGSTPIKLDSDGTVF